MSLCKQAKILSQKEFDQVLHFVQTHRYPLRDKVMCLLSFKAGLRAVEISNLTWTMVTDASGNIGDYINITNKSSKGKNGGRSINMNNQLKLALIDLYEAYPPFHMDNHVIKSQNGGRILPTNISHWFLRVYRALRLDGCSSHSGRRTFGTRGAREIHAFGGSLKDIQQLMGHASIITTQKYVDDNPEAKRKFLQMI
jgi:integrase